MKTKNGNRTISIIFSLWLWTGTGFLWEYNSGYEKNEQKETSPFSRRKTYYCVLQRRSNRDSLPKTRKLHHNLLWVKYWISVNTTSTWGFRSDIRRYPVSSGKQHRPRHTGGPASSMGDDGPRTHQFKAYATTQIRRRSHPGSRTSLGWITRFWRQSSTNGFRKPRERKYEWRSNIILLIIPILRAEFLFLKRLLENKGILPYITLLFQRLKMKIILSMQVLQMMENCLIQINACAFYPYFAY